MRIRLIVVIVTSFLLMAGCAGRGRFYPNMPRVIVVPAARIHPQVGK